MLPAALQVVLVALICALHISGGWCFCPPSSLSLPHQKFAASFRTCKHNPLIIVQSSTSSSDSSFVPEITTDEEETTDVLDKIEKLGKSKRGKKKGDSGDSSTKKAAATLKPEEIFYEGPPAITETIFPTLSILTVVGIIPAAAAWARQAWVRYKITSRRIRVQSGFGGKQMVEIVYPDIVELRTVKRLFGDGDMVAFLRDGAKLEVRNIPNFDATIEFILQQLNPEVVKTYREKGDVSKS